jgi:CheY-like chemotaxis protein
MSSPAYAIGRILIVDDVEDNRAVLRGLLSRRGFNLDDVASGEAALAFIDSNGAPDLVLLDLAMPGLFCGLETLRTLRAAYDTLELPIIVVTCESDAAAVAECLAAGANDFVTKPFVWPVLHARIQTQLSMRRARDVVARERLAHALMHGQADDNDPALETTH